MSILLGCEQILSLSPVGMLIMEIGLWLAAAR